MARVTPGYPTETHTRTRGNPYPQPRVWVFMGTGMGFRGFCGYKNPQSTAHG